MQTNIRNICSIFRLTNKRSCYIMTLRTEVRNICLYYKEQDYLILP